MKLTVESPELTAYALGELPEADRVELEAALAHDPALRAEIDDIRRTVGLLETELARERTVELSPQQRDQIIAHADAGHRESRPVVTRGFFALLADLWRQHQAAFSAVGVAAAAVIVAVAYWPRTIPNKGEAPVSDTEAFVWRYAENKGAASTGSVTGASNLSLSQRANLAAFSKTPAEPVATVTRTLSAVPAGVSREQETLAKSSVPQNQFGLPPSDASNDRGLDGFAGRTAAAGLRGGLAGAPTYGELPAVQAAAAPGDKPRARLYGYGGVEAKSEPMVASRAGVSQMGRSVVRLAERDATVESERSKVKADASVQLGVTTESRAPAKDLALGYLPPAPAPGLRRLSEESHQTVKDDLARPAAPPGATTYALDLNSLVPEAAYKEERYPDLKPNPFQEVRAMPLSTFGLDVDTASYANIRRFVREGVRPPVDAVRVEEMLNYFPYSYAAPHDGKPFGVQVEMAGCPWNPAHRLVRIAVKAREIDRAERPRANLVFLIDVSGSMEPENKLPLVKRSLHLLLEKLGERDTVGVVTYAGEAKVALEPTAVTVDGRQRLLAAIDALQAGHGTHGSAGIETAYTMATNHFVTGGVNRVMLCTDGDFNVGIVSREELLALITGRAKSGVFLSVLGYGMDNYKDSTMELLADRGNGNYAYVDSFREAQKVLSQQVESTLVTVAKDVKAQIEFNPERVVSWRQIGYEKRQLAAPDFNDDSKDAGEIGAGHAVTILYEVVPAVGYQWGVDPLRYAAAAKPALATTDRSHEGELMFLRLRYKEPEGAKSTLIEIPVKDSDISWEKTSADYKFSAAVAGFAEILRGNPNSAGLTWDAVLRLGEQGLGQDRDGYRAEFIDIVRGARKIMGEK